jgi:predicted enzyme related to lactoylglutathione lyase
MTSPAGHFCIAELLTPDPEAAARFYGPLLGWTLVPKADDYFMFRLDGRDVVGVRAAPEIPEPTWVPYVRVDDADAGAKKAVAHGATLISPVSETAGVARTALLVDSERAVFGVWEPRGVDGTDVETGPGSLWWIELATAAKDPADARYASYFDWAVTHTHKFENGANGSRSSSSPIGASRRRGRSTSRSTTTTPARSRRAISAANKASGATRPTPAASASSSIPPTRCSSSRSRSPSRAGRTTR